jgi:hypothetical protein
LCDADDVCGEEEQRSRDDHQAFEDFLRFLDGGTKSSNALQYELWLFITCFIAALFPHHCYVATSCRTEIMVLLADEHVTRFSFPIFPDKKSY